MSSHPSAPPKLSLFSFTMIVVGLVIGLGIFRTAGTSAAKAAEPSVYFTAWILGGVIALCGALTYAEIGSRIQEKGGYYKVFSLAYHPSLAFGINCVILISNAASLAAVALVGAGYFSRLFPAWQFTDIHKALIGVAAVVVFYSINLFGLRVSSRTQNILMLIKIGMLVCLVAGLAFPDAYAPATAPMAGGERITTLVWLKSLGLALVPVSFTYGGYQQTINFGTEVSRPNRNLPRGILLGLLIIVVIYLSVNLAYFKIVGFEAMKTDREVAYTLVQKIAGTATANTFSFLLFFGVLSYINALLLSNPRVMYAMSTDGSLPAWFGRQNGRGVLTVSLTVFTAICLVVLFFSQQFETLLSFSIFLDCFGFVFSTGALFLLRPKTRDREKDGIFTMRWLYPWATLFFMAAYVFVGASIAIDDPSTAGIGLLVLVGLIGIYWLINSGQRNRTDDTNLPAKS